MKQINYSAKWLRREQQMSMGNLATYNVTIYYYIVGICKSIVSTTRSLCYCAIRTRMVSIWKALRKAFSISSFSIYNAAHSSASMGVGIYE